MPHPSMYQTVIVDETFIFEFFEVSKFFRSELTEQIDHQLRSPSLAECKKILVDCIHLDYANSLFLELIIQIARYAEQHQRPFALCSLSEFLRQILEVTRLDDRWTIYDTRQTALANLT